MGDVVNLNKARKARDKAQARTSAHENRVRFGRTKAEKDVARALTDKADRSLDGAKRDD